MADYAAKAQEWAAKADKRLKSFSLFGGNKYEDAAEMYEKAANQFKLAKACERRRRVGGGWGQRGGRSDEMKRRIRKSLSGEMALALAPLGPRSRSLSTSNGSLSSSFPSPFSSSLPLS